MTAEAFGEQLGTLLSTRVPPPDWWTVVITGVLALTVAVTSTHAEKINVISTIFHEGGHALGAFLTGGGVYYIQVRSHDSGTTSVWISSGFSNVVMSLAGYGLPPLVGLGFASLISDQHAPLVLGIVVLAMIVTLFFVRDLVSFGIVVGVGTVVTALLWWGPTWAHTWVATFIAWLLLVSEAAHLVSNSIGFYVHDHEGLGDAEGLAEDTGIPIILWVLAWLGLNGWWLWLAIPLLWP